MGKAGPEIKMRRRRQNSGKEKEGSVEIKGGNYIMKKTNQIRFYERDRMKVQRPVLMWTLFVIYLAVMTWIVLFKFAVSADQLPYIRSLNLVPFQESLIVNDRLEVSEIIMNGIVFVPFGIYLSLLLPKSAFWKRFLAFAGVSLVYEVCQYIFSIGASDITDLIMNCAGGCIGVFLFFLLRAAFGSRTKAETAVSIVMGIGTVIMLVLIGLTLVYNL